jgi:hypothetical protein
MKAKEVKTINESNKKLADELSAIFNTTCEYDYHYERGHWVNGYDGEPGFELLDLRIGTLGFPNLSLNFFLRCINDNDRNEFRAFSKDEAFAQLNELIIGYPDNEGLHYLKLQLDLANTNQNKKAVVKV